MIIKTFNTPLSVSRILLSIYTSYRGILSSRINAKVTVPSNKFDYVLIKSAKKTVRVYRINKKNSDKFEMIEVYEADATPNCESCRFYLYDKNFCQLYGSLVKGDATKCGFYESEEE